MRGNFWPGFGAAKVLGCGKHFPGLGEGKLDSHHELPVIEKPLKKLWAEDLVPYRTLRATIAVGDGVARGVSAGHPGQDSGIAFEDVDHGHSAQAHRLSRSDRVGRSGDGRSAGGGAGRTRRRLEFVRAGGDLCLICHREDYVMQAYEALVQGRGARFEIRAARGGGGAARAGVQEEVCEDSATAARHRSVGAGREIDAAVVGVWGAGAAGAVQPAGRQAAGAAMSEKAMIVAGVMSGTSADGINVALVRIGQAFRLTRDGLQLRPAVAGGSARATRSNCWDTRSILILLRFARRCWPR